MSHFSLSACKIFCLFFSSFILCVWISLSWSCLKFVELPGCVYIKFGKFSAIVSSKSLSVPYLLPLLLRLPLCNNIYWYSWWCHTGLWDSVHFFFHSFFFLFLRLDNLNWLVFRFADSSLHLTSSILIIFISVIALYSPEFLFVSFP